MRDAGVTPTMQRLAILEFLEGTKAHPTADEVYTAVHKTYPTIARATVYNTLEALTKAGAILQLTMDQGAARYDADTGPHVHFRCRVCERVYDVDARQRCLGKEVAGHQVEAIRTYAFGVCASCRKEGKLEPEGAASGEGKRGKKPQAPPASTPTAGTAPENGSKRHPSDTSNGFRARRTRNAP
ncbi:MAG: transcriptional repressor [Candidatus Bipolaricaulis sp.]|nr:transcriptional repressor [Candidatus Bipolaricaulis sp.]